MDALSGLEGMHFVYVCYKDRDWRPVEQQGQMDELKSEEQGPQQRSEQDAGQPTQLASGISGNRVDDADTWASMIPERPATGATTGSFASAKRLFTNLQQGP